MRKSSFSGLIVVAMVVGCVWGAEPGGQASVVGWRGDGTGVYAGATPPTKWDEDGKKGIVWKVKLPSSRYNTPVISGEKIFVLAEPGNLICLDAKTGKELWSKTTGVEDLGEKVELLPEREEVGNATPTPVTDGKNVYVVFANGLVTAFDFEGKRKWVIFRDMPSDTGYGRSASPCLADGKLIVSMGYVAALDCATGKEVWKVEKAVEQFGSPTAGKIGDLPVVVSPTGHVINAKDGSVIEKSKGETSHTTPVIAGDRAYFMDVDSSAVQLGKEKGEIKKVWSGDVEGEFFASPVVYEGLVYVVSNQGELFVLDAKDGKTVYKQELAIANQSGKPTPGPGNIYQSICVAGGHIYVSNEKGETLVIKPGREYSEVAHNQLSDEIAGSLMFSGKRIYVRGKESLYCIE